MSSFKIDKVISTLPAVLEADKVYVVRTGSGFDLYVTENTGTIAYKLNNTRASIEAISFTAAYGLKFVKNIIDTNVNTGTPITIQWGNYTDVDANFNDGTITISVVPKNGSYDVVMESNVVFGGVFKFLILK